MHRDSGKLRPDDLALASVEPGADVESESAHALPDGAGSAHCASGAVERSEEPVARGIDLPSTKARQLASHGGVVGLQGVTPATIAEFGRPPRGVDDVREEDRPKHPARLPLLPSPPHQPP